MSGQGPPPGASPAEEAPVLRGGNRLALLRGGQMLFPAMVEAIGQARHSVWVASYIVHTDPAAESVAQALAAAARRGVQVRVVVDGFGSLAGLPVWRRWLEPAGVALAVFRPLDRWWRLLHPGQLRRLHQKLCVVDADADADVRGGSGIGFVGGINLIDDCHDLNHGWASQPRLDFAVRVEGPLVADIAQAVQAVWTRAALGQEWRTELGALLRSNAPLNRLRGLAAAMRAARGGPVPPAADAPLAPVRAAFLMRDNLRRRRVIEQAYVRAISQARDRVLIVCPYFYPGQLFRRALCRAARRGVRVRLLLQGKVDYRLAALAARVLYDELRGAGVEIHEYTPAWLHAKVALVDDDWATVGSSNIDPLSLLLNLEANVVVREPAFTDELARACEAAIAEATPVARTPLQPGLRGLLQRGFVAWLAHWFLRVAGMSGRY
jgi:cardiolipin synthase